MTPSAPLIPSGVHDTLGGPFRTVLAVVLLACPLPSAASAQTEAPVIVEPGALVRRPDLIGKEVVVEDRVRFFQFHPGQGNDELYLKRCPDVTFALPPALRPQQTQAPAVRVRGTLSREGQRLRVEVTALDMLPADIDRLNTAVAALPRADAEGRSAWGTWAEARAQAFQDEPLRRRAREVLGDAVRAEAERPPRGADPASFFLGLAERARQRQVAEPEPSALAHRGFRAALTTARTAAELTALTTRIEQFLPDARKPGDPGESPEVARWRQPYANDPADAYRAASPAVRSALDRRLWVDATRARIERQVAEEPGSILGRAEEAATLLPDRPEVATTLLEKGLASQARDVAGLKRSEVDSLARLYRERLNQPEKARDLYRTWLDEQLAHGLSDRDAEGRLALAGQYEELLDDRTTALTLLRKAWEIDPQSPEVADAFRRRGYRRVGDEWVEARASRPTPDAPGETASEPGRSDEDRPIGRREGSLLGATPDEVRGFLGGRPNHRNWCATQGQVTEQWVYIEPRRSQYVTFIRRSGELHPRVVSYYSVPRTDAPPER